MGKHQLNISKRLAGFSSFPHWAAHCVHPLTSDDISILAETGHKGCSHNPESKHEISQWYRSLSPPSCRVAKVTIGIGTGWGAASNNNLDMLGKRCVQQPSA